MKSSSQSKDIPEDLDGQVAEILDPIDNKGPVFSQAARFGFIESPPVIKGFCRVCGNKQEMDADFMGPGCAGFSFFPCQHSVEYYKDAELWYNADGSRVDAGDLHEESGE